MSAPVSTGAAAAGSVTRQIWATRAVFFANGMYVASWISRIPAVRDRLDADERSLGFALLFMAVGSLVSMPMAGRLVERLGERLVIHVCIIICLFAYPALGIAPNLAVVAVALFFAGIGIGVWDVAMNVAANAVESRARRILMPGFHGGWSLGSVAGAGLGALAAAAGISPFVHFVVGSVCVAAAAYVATARLPEVRSASDLDTAGLASGDGHLPGPGPVPVLRDTRLIALGVMTFCAAWAEGAAADWLALLLADARDANGAGAAAGFAVFATAMTVGRLAGDGIVNRFGRVRILRAGALVTATGVVILLTVPSLPLSYVAALMWGLGIAVAFPLGMSAAGETPGRGPSGIAMVATIAYTGFLVGPPLIGSVAHAAGGLENALWVVVLLAGGIAALAGVARPPSTDAADA